MSLHAIPSGLDMDKARRLLAKHLRLPSGLVYGNGLEQPPTHAEFVPDLTSEEQTVLARIVKACQTALDFGPDDYAKFEQVRQTLADYFAKNNPTSSETVQAVKALILVARAMVRDS